MRSRLLAEVALTDSLEPEGVRSLPLPLLGLIDGRLNMFPDRVALGGLVPSVFDRAGPKVLDRVFEVLERCGDDLPLDADGCSVDKANHSSSLIGRSDVRSSGWVPRETEVMRTEVTTGGTCHVSGEESGTHLMQEGILK